MWAGGGVPHIYADDLHDLFFARGFVCAQDRLFQIELSRRLGVGRLAEVLGSLAVETDRWSRSLNAPGQSGQTGSRHYAGWVQAWFQGDYYPMLYHRDQVVANTTAILRLGV